MPWIPRLDSRDLGRGERSLAPRILDRLTSCVPIPTSVYFTQGKGAGEEVLPPPSRRRYTQMAHEIFGNRFMDNRAPAWHRLGQIRIEPTGAEEAFDLVGAYDILQTPVFP